jgi:5'-nucleotidase
MLRSKRLQPLKRVLLINDDGIYSIGLLVLKKRLEKLGKVTVVAPLEEKSGIGKALSTNSMKVIETLLADGTKAYAVTGTPADAYLLAVNKIMKKPPDLLVAGINLGPNVGIDDLLNSGTLGAALEAAIHHVPAIAVSYCLREITEQMREKAGVSADELEVASAFAEKTAEYVLEHGMPKNVDIISINVPEKATSENAETTTLSYEGYGDIHIKEGDAYKIKGWILSSYPDDENGTDLYAVKTKGNISITPIRINFHHDTKSLEKLRKFLVARYT